MEKRHYANIKKLSEVFGITERLNPTAIIPLEARQINKELLDKVLAPCFGKVGHDIGVLNDLISFLAEELFVTQQKLNAVEQKLK